MTSFLADSSNNQFTIPKTITNMATATVTKAFKAVLTELHRNTAKVKHTCISQPRRVTFFADEEYLEKPFPSITAIYTKKSATLIDSIKTKAEQDAEDEAAFAALTLSRTRWRPARERTKKIEQTDEEVFAELSFIPLFVDNLTK